MSKSGQGDGKQRTWVMPSIRGAVVGEQVKRIRSGYALGDDASCAACGYSIQV